MQKSGKRVNLFLDNKFFCGLDLAAALASHLKAGQELSQKKISSLINQSLYEELYQKTLNYISCRPRSKKEITDYLKKKLSKSKNVSKKISASLIDKITAKLIKNNFINDSTFAKWWIKQRLEFRPKGKIALKSELVQKGILREIIDEALSCLQSENELSAAKKIYLKAAKQLKSIDPRKRKQRLISRLSSRGFSWEIIKTVLDDL